MAAVGAIARTLLTRGALMTAFFSGRLCGPIVTFCPVLLKSALHGDAGQFSLAVGAFDCGGGPAHRGYRDSAILIPTSHLAARNHGVHQGGRTKRHNRERQPNNTS